MADEGKEFPDDFDPVPTPLTGSERVLVEKGTATIDDVKAFARTNLPAPSAASDAATKGYVDARPGAEEWSEHAATQDVDLDGHKLTGLGEPTDAADAATKAYVDAQAGPPDRIESPSGAAFAEATDDFMGMGFPGSSMVAESNGVSALVATFPGHAAVWAGPEEGYIGGAGFDATYNPASDAYKLRSYGAPLEIEEPAESNHAATKGYVDSKVASMPAPPDLEWWEPTWTAIENVDSVTNVECSYTRTYRAAGGSLVTLEGTITVESLAAGECAATAPVPVPVAGDPTVMGVASVLGPGGTALCDAQLVGDGSILAIGFAAEGDDVHTIAFRLSYRAA